MVFVVVFRSQMSVLTFSSALLSVPLSSSSEPEVRPHSGHLPRPVRSLIFQFTTEAGITNPTCFGSSNNSFTLIHSPWTLCVGSAYC